MRRLDGSCGQPSRRAPARSLAALPASRVILLAMAVSACGGPGGRLLEPSNLASLRLELETVVTGLANPLDLTPAGDASGRLFVVEQKGTIRIIINGALLATPFLDIRVRVTSGGETGRLGLAFHPAYSQNRRFFVNHTRTASRQLGVRC